MSIAMDDLMNEHEAVLFSLSVLEKIVHSMKDDPASHAADLNSLLIFFREFVDMCHHGKEEGILFQVMESYGIERVNGPIAEMINEHDLGRKLVKEMAEALKGDAIAVDRFAAAAGSYITLITNHTNNENKKYFPLAESKIPEDKLDQIYDKFEEYENREIGYSRIEELHDILDALEDKYMG